MKRQGWGSHSLGQPSNPAKRRGRVRCENGAQGGTRAVHGPRPSGSLRLCKLAVLQNCGGEYAVRTVLRGALGPSMALALRAVCGCANWLSCQFVEHRVLTGPLPTNKSKRGLDFHPSPFCFYLAVREGFEPSIRVSVYTLSRLAPSATQTPHRSRYIAVRCNGALL